MPDPKSELFRRVFALILVAWACGSSSGAEDPVRDLAREAEAAREAAGAPALAVVAARPGVDPEVAVAGVRRNGEDGGVTVDDKWHWGSVTKSMTATLVARLVEKGDVSWDDTVGSRLGELAPDMRDEFRDVTYVHLLSHRSGIAANIPTPRFSDFGKAPADPIADRLRWVRIALSQDPVGPKEETFVYSNNGYVVAGAMLEAATGTSWEELMERELFAPLGIVDAGFGAPTRTMPGEHPRGHRPGDDGDVVVPPDADNPAAIGPAGTVHMPMAGIARYLLAHATKREDFLSAESYERLWAPPFGGNYALGWVAIAPDTRWHNGSNNMWYAEAAFHLETGAVAAVVVNDGDIASVQPSMRELLGSLLRSGE